MSRAHLFFALALSLSAASACDEAAEGEFGAGDEIALRPGFGTGGYLLNTSAIGDHPLHELHRKGALHENVELVAVYIRRVYKDKVTYSKLDEVWAEKGELYGRIADLVFHGAQFVGSRWDINTWGGGIVKRTMTVHGYRWDAADGNHKYIFAYPNDPTYGAHYYAQTGTQIKGTSLIAACGNIGGGGMEAVVYENLHVEMKSGEAKEMENLLNIACLDGAVGKSALWGYHPWDIGYPEFTAPIRTIRADYCGDGDSWTKPGTALDVADKWGVNSFFDPTLVTEAIWSRKGALCVTRPRRAEFQLTEVKCGEWVLPDCKSAKLSDFPDALFWTKAP